MVTGAETARSILEKIRFARLTFTVGVGGDRGDRCRSFPARRQV